MTYKLQSYLLEDAALRYHAVIESRDHLAPTIPWVLDYTLEKSQAWIEKMVVHPDGAEYPFKIINDKNEYVGEFRIIEIVTNTYERFASTAYWIRKQYLRQGAASEALKLGAKFAFQELKLWRLQVMILPNNSNSIQVALKAGAKYEGQLRNQWKINEEFKHPLLYSLIAKDMV